MLSLNSISLHGADWKVDTITIEGNHNFSTQELLKVMTLSGSEQYSEWKTEEDRLLVRAFYRSRGFLEVEVEEFGKKINIENQTVDLLVNIKEGEQTILKDIKLARNTIFATQDLLRMEEILPGKPLDGRKLALLKQKILNRYYDRGYLYAEVQDQFYFPAGDRKAEVYFDIEEGKQVRVRTIIIEGNTNLKTYIILRGLEFEPGDIYTERKMQQSKNNLYRIGVLRDIRHELRGLEDKNELIDIVIKVREGDFHSTGVGAGIGDVDGLRGFIEWGHHNLMERAFSLNALTRVTYQVFEEQPTLRHSFATSLTLRQPYFLNSRIDAINTALFEQVGYKHHEERKVGINLLLRNMVTTRHEFSVLLELNQRNIFDVDITAADRSVIDNTGNRITNLISPLVVLDERDDRFNPESGYQMVIKSSLAGGPLLLGSINFYLFSFQGSMLMPLLKRPRKTSPLVLAGRLKLGVIREFGGTASVPPSEAFNIGGGKSLRGYSELSVGPLNDRNVPGNFMVMSNLELRYKIRGSLGGVLFLDAANVFRNLYFDERFHLLATAGAGFRYRTPVGPIRIDAALKLNNFLTGRVEASGDELKKERDSKARIHFGIGHAF
jgi:outer membrane protein assembly complex protein YaeT